MSCPGGEVGFSKDQSFVRICGECDPYQELSCGIHNYCTDLGECVPVEEHPLFEKPCSYDLECGTLRCFNRRCGICQESEVVQDYECISGKYGAYLKAESGYLVVMLLMMLFAGAIALTIYTFFIRHQATKRAK